MREKRDRLKKPEGVELPATAGETVCAFLFTVVFAAVALLPWMLLKDMVPPLVIILTGNPDTYQFATIATVVIAGIAWLSAFYLLWHRMEKHFTYKTGAIMALKWTGSAALLFAVLTVLRLLMDRFLLGIGS